MELMEEQYSLDNFMPKEVWCIIIIIIIIIVRLTQLPGLSAGVFFFFFLSLLIVEIESCAASTNDK